jgi:hypothetical protein
VNVAKTVARSAAARIAARLLRLDFHHMGKLPCLLCCCCCCWCSCLTSISCKLTLLFFLRTLYLLKIETTPC